MARHKTIDVIVWSLQITSDLNKDKNNKCNNCTLQFDRRVSVLDKTCNSLMYVTLNIWIKHFLNLMLAIISNNISFTLKHLFSVSCKKEKNNSVYWFFVLFLFSFFFIGFINVLYHYTFTLFNLWSTTQVFLDIDLFLYKYFFKQY